MESSSSVANAGGEKNNLGSSQKLVTDIEKNTQNQWLGGI